MTTQAVSNQRFPSRRRLLYAAITGYLLVMAGCIPATLPDNLDDTPGPPVVFDGTRYTGSRFTASVPDGWRVVTSEAQAPQGVIFVAPDDKTLIHLLADEVDMADVAIQNQRNELDSVALADGSTVSVLFSSPASTWDHYWAIFETVRDSISSR